MSVYWTTNESIQDDDFKEFDYMWGDSENDYFIIIIRRQQIDWEWITGDGVFYEVHDYIVGEDEEDTSLALDVIIDELNPKFLAFRDIGNTKSTESYYSDVLDVLFKKGWKRDYNNLVVNGFLLVWRNM